MTQMVGLNHVLLNLLYVVSDNVHVWVFLSVDGTLLQTHEYFGELHGGCSCADCIPVRDMIFVGHNTDLLTL